MKQLKNCLTCYAPDESQWWATALDSQFAGLAQKLDRRWTCPQVIAALYVRTVRTIMKRLFFLGAALMVFQTACTEEPPKPTTDEPRPVLRAYPTMQIGTTDQNRPVSAIDTVMHSGAELVVYGTPVFTEHEVIGTEEMTMPNAMSFRLDESGSRALRDYTRGAIQQRMAIRFRDRGWASRRSRRRSRTVGSRSLI
ncbi:hypothetical protein HN588_10345 [Candidatus Bathyarchaeota archaeon]|nr:hypothetical protein [Candidatus Bathyarchaeota archaeon]